MGTPVPPIDVIPPGELCPNCWGLDGAFGAGPTPSKLIVEFVGIEKDIFWDPGDDEPPNGVHAAEQREGLPCYFGIPGGPDGIAINFFPMDTSFALWSSTGTLAFSALPVGACLLEVVNTLTGRFHLGTATILL